LPRIGARVAIFDIDPNAAGLACCRFLGLPSSTLFSYSDCKTILTSLLPKSVIDSGFDLSSVLTTLNIEIGTLVDMKALFKRIFVFKEKFVSSCDRLLLGHSNSIVSISFLKSSNLLVTVDSEGSCCIWDPFSKLSIVGMSPSCTAATGAYPYALVSKVELSSQARGNLRVHSTFVSPIRSAKKLNMPVSNSAFLKALSVDQKYKPSDVLLRCMFYVLPDMSVVSLRTNSFNLTLVTLENSEDVLKLFLISKESDSVCSKIFKAKGNIIRSVYVVSCTHSSVTSLEKDLQQFGVFQKGYADTPSELLSIVCFERNPRSCYMKLSNVTISASGKSGILLSSSDGGVRVGLDYSNDIVQVNASSLHTLFDRLIPSGGVSGKLRSGDRVEARYRGGSRMYPGKISYDHKDGTFDIDYDDGEKERNVRSDLITSMMPLRIDNTSDTTSLGSHVFFKDSYDISKENDFDQTACEVLYVTAENGESTCIFPLLIGRTCLPVSASNCNVPLSSDDFYKARESYLQFYRVYMGMSGVYNMFLDRSRVYKQNSMRIMRSTVISSLFTDKNVSLEYALIAFLSYISSSDCAERVAYLSLYVKLGRIGTSLAHPLMAYLENILMGVGADFLHHIRDKGFCSGTDLSIIFEKW